MIGIHSAIVGKKNGTLPSSDDWSSQGIPNIYKQPSSSIEIPRKIRVGMDNTILEEIEDSYDRIRDSIKPFARGVNPMVSVQMQNSGNLQTTETSLPYKIQAFRPPILKQEDTLPLSRLNRNSTQAFTLPNKISNQKPYSEIKELKTRPLVVETVCVKLPKPEKAVEFHEANLEKGRAPARKLDIFQIPKENQNPIFENPNSLYLNNPLKIEQNTNKFSKNISTIQSNLSAERFINNKNNTISNVITSKSLNLQKQNEFKDIILKDAGKIIDVSTIKSSNVQPVRADVQYEINFKPIHVDFNSTLNIKKQILLDDNRQAKGDYLKLKNCTAFKTGMGYVNSERNFNLSDFNPVKVEANSHKSQTGYAKSEMAQIQTRDRPVSKFGYANT
jgi:hypothetical protein